MGLSAMKQIIRVYRIFGSFELSARGFLTLALLPALLASGSVDHVSARIWAYKSLHKRQAAELADMRKRTAEYQAAHPNQSESDVLPGLATVIKLTAERNPAMIVTAEREVTRDGATVTRTRLIDPKTWIPAKPWSELDPGTDYAKVPKSLAEIPEEKLDIARAALTLEREIWPDLDIEEYSQKIDLMVSQIAALTRGSTNPEIRIGTLNTYLFKMRGFHYNGDDPLGEKTETRTLRGILDTKAGNCFSMPLLYLSLAQRLGYPVKGTNTPRHSLLRYDDPNYKSQNIEVTAFGQASPDEVYINDMKISEKAIKRGLYLRTLTNKEYLALLIAHAGVYWENHNWKKLKSNEKLKNVLRALQYLAVAENLDQKNDMIVVSTAYAYRKLEHFEIEVGRKLAERDEMFRHAIKQHGQTSNLYFARANWLGVNPHDFSDEHEKEYLAEVTKINKNHEEAMKGFAEERKRYIELMQRNAVPRGPL